MHGWQQLAEVVARVHRALPPEDRARACVFPRNYGQAGAIDLFGPALGLPPVISGHNNHWLWGTRGCSGEVMILMGGPREDYTHATRDVRPAALFDCQDCLPMEDNQTIWIGRDRRRPLSVAWPRAKHFD